MHIYGGIEAGGTKFVCTVAAGPQQVLAEMRFPTTTPEETLARTAKFFEDQQVILRQPLAGIGIACFGPLDLNPTSPSYGSITTTPKPGWPNTAIAGSLGRRLSLPVAIDTDVNAAAFGEAAWGGGRGLANLIYFTVGTGIGGGVITQGKPQHGLVHPEVGHIYLPHDRQADPYAGNCPYHGDCFEGLACGPAMQARWGQRAETLPPEHPAWALEAHYIALALHNVICTLSPQRIILGGGVMQQTQLFPMIRQRTRALLHGYVQAAAILENIDAYIVPPGLGNQAGMSGAVALIKQQVEGALI